MKDIILELISNSSIHQHYKWLITVHTSDKSQWYCDMPEYILYNLIH